MNFNLPLVSDCLVVCYRYWPQWNLQQQLFCSVVENCPIPVPQTHIVDIWDPNKINQTIAYLRWSCIHWYARYTPLVQEIDNWHQLKTLKTYAHLNKKTHTKFEIYPSNLKWVWQNWDWLNDGWTDKKTHIYFTWPNHNLTAIQIWKNNTAVHLL